MMQVSTLYAHSLEKQLVARRSQNLIKSLSKTCKSEKQQRLSERLRQERRRTELAAINSDFFIDDFDSSRVEILPVAFERSLSCPAGDGTRSSLLDLAINDTNNIEYADRLCKLPTQGRRGQMLISSPRRHSAMSATLPSSSANNLSLSSGHLNVSSHVTLVKSQSAHRNSLDNAIKVNSKAVMNSSLLNLTINDKKHLKKSKGKAKGETKRIPSNFMYLGSWTTKQHCDRLLEQVKSGDVLEFNIKFHHHWGIAVLPKNKKPTLSSLELIHLKKDIEGRQRVVKETLVSYWVEGVTSRINNSRDVHKPPSTANEVVITSLKLTSQPYRVWQNSEQLIAYCRYGERARCRQMSEAARWSTLSKCVGMWMNIVSSRHSSPSTSPPIGRKRFLSVNF